MRRGSQPWRTRWTRGSYLCSELSIIYTNNIVIRGKCVLDYDLKDCDVVFKSNLAVSIGLVRQLDLGK